jgi:hypothetical protein
MASPGKRMVADYSKLGAGPGGSYLKVFIRFRPPEPSAGGDLAYSLPEPHRVAVKEDKDPLPTEHVFSFHHVFDKDSTQDVRPHGRAAPGRWRPRPRGTPAGMTPTPNPSPRHPAVPPD